MPAEVVDEQVRRREDATRSPTTSAITASGNDDDDGEDRQRRAHQEPEEHDGRHLDAAERAGGYLACDQGVLFELVGGDVSGVGVVMAVTFALARARSRPGECRVESLVRTGGPTGVSDGCARRAPRRSSAASTQPEEQTS